MTADTAPTVLVTGVAGFIGYHAARRLLADGWRVSGVDNLSDYYDPRLKEARLDLLLRERQFSFRHLDIANTLIRDVVAETRPHAVLHLAAQAGVRHSIDHPDEYVRTNLDGFFQVLEACRRARVAHFVYASSSSVYGSSSYLPFVEDAAADRPLSLYAATKRANELMAHSYSHLHGIPATGLRFFTVYGPFGRPDMALYSFTDSWFRDQPITIFTDSGRDLSRDFTYVEDVVEAIARTLHHPPDGPDPHRVLNVGRGSPVGIREAVKVLEGALGRALGRMVRFETMDKQMQPGDVRATWASTDALRAAIGYAPSTTLPVGLQQFANWYIQYRGVA